jgi:hypothetical protein
MRSVVEAWPVVLREGISRQPLPEVLRETAAYLPPSQHRWWRRRARVHA